MKKEVIIAIILWVFALGFCAPRAISSVSCMSFQEVEKRNAWILYCTTTQDKWYSIKKSRNKTLAAKYYNTCMNLTYGVQCTKVTHEDPFEFHFEHSNSSKEFFSLRACEKDICKRVERTLDTHINEFNTSNHKHSTN